MAGFNSGRVSVFSDERLMPDMGMVAFGGLSFQGFLLFEVIVELILRI